MARIRRKWSGFPERWWRPEFSAARFPVRVTAILLRQRKSSLGKQSNTYSSFMQLYKTNGVLRRRCVAHQQKGMRSFALLGNRKSLLWQRPPKNIHNKGTGLIVSQIMFAGVSNGEISVCVCVHSGTVTAKQLCLYRTTCSATAGGGFMTGGGPSGLYAAATWRIRAWRHSPTHIKLYVKFYNQIQIKLRLGTARASIN